MATEKKISNYEKMIHGVMEHLGCKKIFAKRCVEFGISKCLEKEEFRHQFLKTCMECESEIGTESSKIEGKKK